MLLPRNRGFLLALLAILLLVVPGSARAADPKVYVVLWFDTEDYILPASDDSALKLADWLSQEGVRATFKVVGEKARTLERRKRDDVIAALRKHEIGYHSNFHSVQPSPAMYLSNVGWDEGVAEFDRREKPGYDDVKRIFGQAPSCYGQPGSSWAPQVYGAMRNWGMQVYLDAGRHVGLDDKPCYYDGMLTLYKLAHQLRTGLNAPEELDLAEGKFLDARKALQEDGGGIVSIYYHPCEFVQKEFWDGVNFSNGANPPRERWKLPAVRTAEESKAAWDNFQGYIRFIKRFPDVRFITASAAAKLYRDAARGHAFTPAELRDLATGVTDQVTFQKRDGWALSASEVFALLNDFVAEKSSGRNADTFDCKATPYGPSNPVASLAEPVNTDWSQFTRTSVDVADYVRKQGRIPTSVWLGSTPVPPESYLVALAGVARDLIDGKSPPETVEVKPARLAVAAYVSDDDPKLWSWIIFPRGFKAPAMMELAKRQSWTLKPALLAESLPPDPAVVELRSPVPRQVIQREGFVPARAYEHQPGGPELGFAMVPVSGKFPAAAKSFEYRVVLEAGAFGHGTDWMPLDGKFADGELRASARVSAGGWYRLEVRARDEQRIVATAIAAPIGVGELFVVAGQSYATNCNDERLKVADPAGRVVAFDLHDRWRIAHDPQPTPDGSDGGSIWPAFGDALLPVARVPIGFVNVAVGGTSSRQWLPGTPLFDRLRAVAGQVGRFRAVLWQQGESDVIEGTTTEKYVANIKAIREQAAQAWGFDPPWLLAKSTLHPTVYNKPDGEGRIRAAIDELCRLPGFRPGPDTDILGGPNRGGPGTRHHFTGQGQHAAALLWFAAVWTEFTR